MGKILINIIKILTILLLPFTLLIRGSVWLHEEFQLMPWLCILGGMMVTIILLFIYFSLFYGQLTGEFGKSGALKRRLIIAFLVGRYVFHTRPLLHHQQKPQ